MFVLNPQNNAFSLWKPKYPSVLENLAELDRHPVRQLLSTFEQNK